MKGLGNAKIFAENLRHYINASGRLDKDVAAAIGVATTTFSEWVNGKKYPRIDKIEMLANYFHIQKSDLIEDKENKPDSTIIQANMTPIFKIISGGVAELPLSEQERVLGVLRGMYCDRPGLFERKDVDDNDA